MVELGLLFIYVVFARVLPFSLAVTATLVLARRRQRAWLSLICVMFIGMIESVTMVARIGQVGLWLLVLYALVWWLSKQYRSGWGWWYGLGLVGQLGMFWISGTSITLAALGWQLAALWSISWLLGRFGRTEGIYVER